MSNQLAVNDMNATQLMAMMGGAQQQQKQESNLLPILRINYQEEDDAGNELKKGTLFLQGVDTPIYAKEATFRALGDYMQYLHYSQADQEVVNRSIVHRMGDEPIDEKGTVRCGRPTSKELMQMDQDTKAKYKEITCFRYIYGIVSMKGTDAEGNEGEVVNQPCLFRMKGSSFLNFSKEVIDPCNGKGVQFQQVPTTLSTKRHKNGSVIYFTAHFDPDFSKQVEISPEDMEIMRNILSLIKHTNDQVKAKYNEALQSKQRDTQVIEAMDAELVEADDLDF